VSTKCKAIFAVASLRNSILGIHLLVMIAVNWKWCVWIFGVDAGLADLVMVATW